MASKLTRGGKKKRTFLYKVRKYAKKGMYGRGRNVDEDSYNYFVRVMERLREDFEDDEDKEIFVANVFEQTYDKEMDLMCNQVISKILEKLLPMAKPETFHHFAEIALKEMRIVCTDPYASHVLEKIMLIALSRVPVDGTEQSEGSHAQFCKKWLLSTCQFAFNNIEDFIADIYASHIVRTSIQCVSGVQVGVLLMKSRRSRNHLKGKEGEDPLSRQYPPLSLDLLRDFAERFISWGQLPDFVYSDNSSAVVQTVLYSLHTTHPKLCEKLLNLLVSDILPGFEGDVFEYSSAIHLLETCLSVATSENLTNLFDKYFRGRLKELASDEATKFAVVKLLENTLDKELFTTMFEELCGSMEDVFGAGCAAVVLAMAEACRRLSSLQGRFLQHLMQAVHCHEPEIRQSKLVTLVSRLITFEIACSGGNSAAADGEGEEEVKESYPVHYLGSQIVQTLLNFNKPIKLVQSLLAMDTTELKELFCDPCGCRIMDAYVAAEFVGEKSRDKLAQKLQGNYFSLASTKHGSRALDALWESCDVKWRVIIGEELLQKESALQNTLFGRIISDKYALPLLKRQKVDWKTNQEKQDKKRKLFADLVADTDDTPKTAKKVKKEKKCRQQQT